MMRKAAAVLTAICCLVASQVYALGLGSLSLESSLNQPLRARIEVVDLGGVSPADIVVQMGSQQDFQRFNLERTNFFSDVDFTIENTAQGVFIVLSSNQSVREPYLSFILDTRWSSGRILSEHTVLLDLPVFSDGRSVAEPINQPVSPEVEADPGVERQQPAEARPAATAATPTTEPELEPEVASEPDPRVTETVITEAPASPDSLEVQESDTLWEVAMRVRPDDSVTIQQTMLAIQRLNPDAFVGGNINRLRAGETLRVPDLSQVQSISQQQAVSEVTRQNQQAELNVQPLTAPASGPRSLASGEEQGQLRVLTAEQAEPAGSGASAAIEAENTELDARIQALENQLALQEEETDRARLQQTELVGRLNDLNEQIASAMEIVSLQDQQLAQLQQSLADAAVQASLQQGQAPAEAAQPAILEPESQPVRTAQPSILGSVATVLNNNSLILIIVSVLVVLLMVMLLVRRNRAVTAEGFEVEFEGDSTPSQGAPGSGNDERLERVEPDEETVLAVAGIAGSALAEEEDEEFIAAEDVEKVISESDELDELDSDEAETDFDDSFDQQAESEIDVYDLSEETAETTESEATVKPVSDHETRAYVDEDIREQEQPASGLAAEAGSLNADITGIEVPEGTEQAQAEEAGELDDIVDFELDTEVDSEDEQEQSASVVDFDIDEFLEEDEVAESGLGEQQSEGTDDSSNVDQGIDFELDTEVEEDEAESEDESAEIDLGEVEFSAEADNEAVEQIDVDADEESDAESELDLDTFALEEEESTEASSADSVPDEEIESLDFDLSGAGISELGEEGGTDLESASDSEVETFDFELGAEETEEGLESEEAEESTSAESAETAESLDGVDFEFSTEPEVDESADNEKQDVEEAADPEAVEFEPAETTATIEAESESEADSEAEMVTEEEVVFEAEEEPEVAIELVDEEEAELETETETKTKTETDTEPKADSTDDELPDANDEISDVLALDEEVASPDSEGELDFLSTDMDSAVDGAEQDSEVLSDDDEAATKLDLAYAYQKMGDVDGAKEILEEVLKEGNDSQVSEAKNLIEALQ